MVVLTLLEDSVSCGTAKEISNLEKRKALFPFFKNLKSHQVKRGSDFKVALRGSFSDASLSKDLVIMTFGMGLNGTGRLRDHNHPSKKLFI